MKHHLIILALAMPQWSMPSPELTLESAYKSIEKYEYASACRLYTQAYEQASSNSEIILSLGFALKKMNRYQEAIALYEHARPFVARKSQIERALSGAYLALGDYEHGWPAYEYRWVNPPNYNQEFKDYLAHGGSLKNKIVLLKTEYGLGDTLQFIRYAQILKEKGARVIIESQQALAPLLSLCPYIDEIHPQGAVIPAHFIVLLMSMPWAMQTNAATIPVKTPYLYADQTLVTEWKNQIDHTSFNIGICWQADKHINSDNQTVVRDAQEKSIPVSLLNQLSQLPRVKLYSLQKTADELPEEYHIQQFKGLDTAHGPFMDTAALMRNLDLVITIDTSIAHLAGGLGVPCWLLLCHGADWRWLHNRDESPWYPGMRLFRQKVSGNWDAVVEEVKNALKKKI